MGASSRRLLILGEAPAAEELRLGVPFVGASGHMLRKELFPDAGLVVDDWAMANAMLTSAPQGNIRNLTLTKTDAKKLDPEALAHTPWQKRYFRSELHEQFNWTRDFIAAFEPEFVIAFGATALWLLTGDASIGKSRGNIFSTPWGHGLATYHPSMVQAQYSFKPVVWADLRKVAKHLAGTLAPPMRRTLWIDPTLLEIADVFRKFNNRPASEPLGVDIETAMQSITCISFSFADEGICIPIWDKDTGKSYWPDAATEATAWKWIARFCNLPHRKVLQNGLYDMQYMLAAPLPLRLRAPIEDTSILHHALQPELKKDLGMLASLYLNEPSWKYMRTSNKDAKAED